MILSTTPQIEGHPIREYKGVVTGETIIGANMFKDFLAGIRDIVGGRSGSYEKVLMEAKDTSMQEMMQRAQALGANAIVGIDIDYETVSYNLDYILYLCNRINKDMSYEKEGLIVDDGFDVGAGLSGNGCYWS